MVWCRTLLGFFACRQPSTWPWLHSPASVFICVFTRLSVAAHSVGISGEGRAGNYILIFRMFHCTWEHFDLTNTTSQTKMTAILGHWRRRWTFPSERSHSTVTELICLFVGSSKAVVGYRSSSVARRRSEPTAAITKLHKVVSNSKWCGLRNT